MHVYTADNKTKCPCALFRSISWRHTRRGAEAPYITNLRTRRTDMVSLMPQSLDSQQNIFTRTTEQEAVWAPELVWMGWRTEESFGLPRNQMWFLSCLTHSLVTVPTELVYAHVTICDTLKSQTASLQFYKLLPSSRCLIAYTVTKILLSSHWRYYL